MILKIWLEQAGKPVAHFAREIGVCRSTIYKYIDRRAVPRPATVRRIENATGGAVTVADMQP